MMGGLTLEEEPYTLQKEENEEKFTHEFAGTVITGTPNADSFEIETINKNWDYIRCIGEQKKARYPPAASYIHERVKTGMIIGSFVRMTTQKKNSAESHKKTKT